MTEFKIEKGVPLVPKRAPRLPWPDMKVGDSIGELNFKHRNAAYAWAHDHPPVKFSIRTQSDGTYRVWRVK